MRISNTISIINKRKPVKFGDPMIKGADQENQNTNISKKRSISKNDTPISNKRINIKIKSHHYNNNVICFN